MALGFMEITRIWENIMRTARKKMVGRGCLYHVVNRLSGPKDCLLFTDVDKEVGFKLFEEISRFYLVDIISISMMSNHFLCGAPHKKCYVECSVM